MNGQQQYHLDREYQKDMLRAAQHAHLAMEARRSEDSITERLNDEYATTQPHRSLLATVSRSAVEGLIRWFENSARAQPTMTRTEELRALK